MYLSYKHGELPSGLCCKLLTSGESTWYRPHNTRSTGKCNYLQPYNALFTKSPLLDCLYEISKGAVESLKSFQRTMWLINCSRIGSYLYHLVLGAVSKKGYTLTDTAMPVN
jgi:hypothetical protein